MKKTVNQKMNLKGVSIQTNIFISFTLILLSAIMVIGYITYSNWMNCAVSSIDKELARINNEIIKEVEGIKDENLLEKKLMNIAKNENVRMIVVDKKTGEIVARSLLVDETDNGAIIETYDSYIDSGIDQYKVKYKNEKFHVKLTQYQAEAINWVLVTALPSKLMMVNVNNSLKTALILTVLAIVISLLVFTRVTKKYIGPLDHLIKAQEEFAKGNLFARSELIRDDEIGKAVHSFNSMADTIYTLIYELENKVEERTSRLQLILDSTAEGVFGMDLDGNCTFINASGLEILGYEDRFELIGKSIHSRIHHSHRNKMPMPEKECTILKALTQEKGSYVDDEVFWRQDGTSFSVKYSSYPQLSNGKVVGAVVTFVDYTEKREKQKKIEYLSIHDQLTGLYNRWYMESIMSRLDAEKELPFTIMVIDVNGLKLVNDAFGHEMGDQLLKVVANVLKNVLRTEDIVGRMGGDEFLVLLPKTDQIQANQIKKKMLKAISLEKLDSVIISVAIGYAVKENQEERMDMIMISADNQMYKDKLKRGKTMRNQTVKKILNNINLKYDHE